MRGAFWTTVLAGLVLGACDCGAGGELSRLAPDLAATPSPLVFDTIPIGASVTATVALVNQGDVALEVRAVRLEGDGPSDFTLQLAAPSFTLQPSDRVEVTVRYTPSAAGAQESAILIDSTDPDTPELRVPILAMRRDGPVLLVCAESLEIPLARRCAEELDLDFGDVPVGEYREALVELRNQGIDPISVSAAGLASESDPGFSLTSTSARAIAPGAALRLPVRFVASAPGAATGTLRVSSSVGPRAIALSARAVEPALCVRPATLELLAPAIDAVVTGTVTASNCGDVDLSLTDVAVLGGPGPFRVLNPLASPVNIAAAAGLSLRVGLAYAPADAAPHEARVRFTSDRGVSVISARGRVESCDLTVTPASLRFSPLVPERALLIANEGTSDCLFRGVAITEDPAGAFSFGAAQLPQEQRMAPGASLQLAVFGLSFGEQTVRGKLTVFHGEARPQTIEVPLVVGPTELEPCTLVAEPSMLQFGAQAPGTERALGLLVGPAPTRETFSVCALEGAELLPGSDPSFSVEPLPAPTVDNFGAVLLTVRFRPRVAAGLITGTLRIRHDGPAGYLDVPVSGIADAPSLCVSPPFLDFGVTQVESETSLDLVACGTRAVTVTALDWAVADAELALARPPALPFTLAPGQRRGVAVRYRPADEAGDTAVLRIASDDVTRPETEVRITGGARIVPPEAGRFLYLWQIFDSDPTVPTQGEIARMPLQGNLLVEPFVGPRTGRGCTGCHAVSPDGRYLSFVELDNGATLASPSWSIRVVEIATRLEALLPLPSVRTPASWRPDPNSDPPYQLVYTDAEGDLSKASLLTGLLGKIPGADSPFPENMPAWGPDGTIVFVREDGSLWRLPEAGGVAAPVPFAAPSFATRNHPSFSRDGRWIAYSAYYGIGDRRVELVAADGSGRTLQLPELNEPGVENTYPRWSLDGRYLSFASKRPGGAGGWDVYLSSFDPATEAVGPATPVPGLNDANSQLDAEWSP
jgi:hypothetical protein